MAAHKNISRPPLKCLNRASRRPGFFTTQTHWKASRPLDKQNLIKGRILIRYIQKDRELRVVEKRYFKKRKLQRSFYKLLFE
ncbi:hypothetical protein LguiA_022980 [Lonicera macranthoides]